jgi:hypothetical protein
MSQRFPPSPCKVNGRSGVEASGSRFPGPRARRWDASLDPPPSATQIRPDPQHSPDSTHEVAMVPILSLWLPILAAAVLVFVASSLIHMILKYHANDYAAFPDEIRVAESLRPLEPGQYVIPYAGSMKAMSEPEYAEKQARGPVALVTIRRPGPPDMGRSLAVWFLFAVVVSIFAAYVTGRALPPGADYLAVFRFAGTSAFLAYAVGTWSESIWFGRPWSTTLKNTVDGIIYAAVTAGAFGWLWPGA